MNSTLAFLSVTITIALYATLSIDTSNDWYNGLPKDTSTTDADKQEFAKTLLEKSGKDIVFIENIGQIRDTKGEIRPDILFHTRSEGVDMYLTQSGMTYVFRKFESESSGQSPNALSNDAGTEAGPDFYRLDMEFVGMNKGIKISKEQAIQQQYHYYNAGHPDGLSPKAFKKITVENLYDGIDLVYYEKEGRLKYDFILKAGADADKIQMKYTGASALEVDTEGNVIITTPMGEISEEKPYTYSESTGLEIESMYHLIDDMVMFDLAEYDEDEDIVIDPVRIWATYYGGNGFDQGNAICTDNSNNLYVTGSTSSTNFPSHSWTGAYDQTSFGGERDAFILKFNSSGERIWATYYGGSDHDAAWGVCTDNSDNLFVTGRTQSNDFPLQALSGAYNQSTKGDTMDVFILKFNSDGTRQWATYYGGNDYERPTAICTDNSDNLFITGLTKGASFPTQILTGAYNQTTFGGGAQDAFVLRFDSNGARQWATYYGGSGDDAGRGLCADNLGNVYITGEAGSTDFPVQTSAGAYNQNAYGGGDLDAFILKFDSGGQRTWATLYGGSTSDAGHGICTDDLSNIYVTGTTGSGDFPTQVLAGAYNQSVHGGGDWDAFILKFDPSGTRQWATYYGGFGPLEEIGRGLCTDDAGNLYVTGDSRSTDFPIQTFPSGYNQTSAGGPGGPGHDAFILIFNSTGVRQWATFYGGANSERAFGISLDNSNNLYIAGPTWAPDFPTQTLPGSYNQTTLGGVAGVDFDAFILRFRILAANFSVSDCATGAGGTVAFTDQSLGTYTSWNWTFEGGTPASSSVQNPVVTYDATGSFDVQLIVSDGTISDTLLKNDLITVYGSGASCGANTDNFPTDPLTHTGPGSSTTTLSYSPPHWDVAFTVSDIDQKLKGPESKHYIEKVTVSYVDCSGQNQIFGEYTGDIVSSAEIFIPDVVQSVTVTLSDALDGDSGSSTMSVSLGEVSSCGAPGSGCPDADEDGVCDADDICPGYDDNIDSDGDGIPDGCDNCTSVNNDFPNDPLTHSGSGSSFSSHNFGSPGSTDVSFTVSDLDAKINGNPGSRYIDVVTVTYTDAGGTQTYGTFSGEIFSSINVDIAGPVYSVTLELEDGYDGNPPGTLSVDPGSIASCPSSGALQVSLDIAGDTPVEQISELTVYPNPARDVITVRYQLNQDSEIDMRIMNINGVAVYSRNAHQTGNIQENQIDVSQLPEGMYLLHLASVGQVISRKFVVMR